MTYNLIILITYVVLLVVMSVISMFLYKKDKKLSQNNNSIRIKEKTLLGITVLGGALGSFIARIIFRHKTNKSYFSITIYFSLLLEILTLALLIYFTVTRGANI